MPARGVAALGVAIRFASAPIIRCRSACDSVALRNFRLLWLCTVLLVPAKAALLRSPRLGGAFLAGIGFFFVGQTDEIVDACVV